MMQALQATPKKKASSSLALMLTVLSANAAPALASRQTTSLAPVDEETTSPESVQQGQITATGVLERAAQHGQDRSGT